MPGAFVTEQVLRLFVSSPADVPDERRRVDLVIERLNAEFEGRARIEVVRWETSYYSAHDTFQKQIPEAADCDVVVALFRARLGTPLPETFPHLPTGEPYPSGTAYEVLSAIEARNAGKGIPDIYVFRYPSAPSVPLDAPDRIETEAQWERLKAFFDTWFRNKSGEFLAAFQTYSSTDDFAAKVEDCLRQWLARRGFAMQGPVWDRVARGSPFPGLSAFDVDRGSVFFGRDLAISQAVERLRQAGAGGPERASFLLIIGASGSGKSSLLRAGLLPRLTLPGSIPEIDLWRTAIVTPGPDPFLSLAEAVFADAALGPELRQGTFRTKELLAKQLAGDVDIALAPLRDALDKAAARRQADAHYDAPRPARLALAIDQAERLFIETDAKTAAAFADLLAALVRRNLAYLVMALRSDAYARFQGFEALLELRRIGATFDLVPPTAAELEEIVTQPVAACRPALAFEPPSLAAKLVTDAKGGDALPLLQMTLSRLYTEEAGRNDGTLRASDYRGMDSAVTETANEALGTLDADAKAELPALVAGLVADVVTDPRTGILTPVVVALDRQAFEANKPARAALVKAFVDKRLLTSEGDGASQRVRPVHEALLRIWPEAVAIVGEVGHLIRIRHTLEPLVREWEAAPEATKAGHLELSPALLDGAQQLVVRFGDDLPKPMRDFIAQAAAADAARRDKERQEQERRIRDAQKLAAANKRIAYLTMAGLAVAVVLVVLAGWQWREAQKETKEAQAQRDRAERTLGLSTQTANALVFDLAQKFRDVAGVPATMIKDILERATEMQDQLLKSGESTPELRRSQGAALDEIADTLLTLGETKQALGAATRARDIFQELLKTRPESTDIQRELSVALNKVGDTQLAGGRAAEALKSYEAGLTLVEHLNQINPNNEGWEDDLLVSHDRIGSVQIEQGHLREALKSYKASQTIAVHLTQVAPNKTGWQRALSIADNRVGDVEMAQGHLTAALKSYQDGLVIADRLAKSAPSNAGRQSDLMVSYERVGSAQVAGGHLPEALESYEDSLDIAIRLARADPGNADWQRGVSVAFNKVGDVQVAQNRLTDAARSYGQGLVIAERLVKIDPGNAGVRRDLSISYERVGDVRLAQNDLGGALKSYQQSLVIRGDLTKMDPGNAGWWRDLSLSYAKIAYVYGKAGQTPDERKMLAAGRAIIAPLVAQHPDWVQWHEDLVWFDRRIATLDGKK